MAKKRLTVKEVLNTPPPGVEVNLQREQRYLQDIAPADLEYHRWVGSLDMDDPLLNQGEEARKQAYRSYQDSKAVTPTQQTPAQPVISVQQAPPAQSAPPPTQQAPAQAKDPAPAATQTQQAPAASQLPAFLVETKEGIGVKPNMTRDEVKQFQTWLNTQGGDPIKVDGIAGPKTVSKWNQVAKAGLNTDVPGNTATGTTQTPGGAANAPAQQPGPNVNTSVTTEQVDADQVQELTSNIIKAMREQGLTYSQAYEKYYPRPTLNKEGVDHTQKLQKAAVIADMIRLATEGVGAFAGANINRRDSSALHNQLAARLMQQYAEYSKNMQDWQTKGVDAAMKDIQAANELYNRNLSAAPRTRTTVQDNAWDREKHRDDKMQQDKKLKQDKELAANANATRLRAANIAQEGKKNDPEKVTQIVFSDNSGYASIPKEREKSFYNAAYQAMLSDSTFRKSGNTDAKMIESINNDYSFEGKAAKIRIYVDQYIHQSPQALELLKSNSIEFNHRGAPQTAPWAANPAGSDKTAPWAR